jgi:integrase
VVGGVPESFPEMRFHDLRHTYASMMLAFRTEPYEVSRWMGHADINTTDSIYAHVYKRDNAAKKARVDRYFGRLTTESWSA